MSKTNKRGSQEDDQPRDSSDNLLAMMRQSASSREGVVARGNQIAAWNNMADRMIDVVKTIKGNELRLAAWEERMRRLVVGAVLVAVLLAGVAVFYNMKVVRATEHLEVETRSALADLRERQDRLLGAVAGLAAAQAVGIEADLSYNPQTEHEAKAAALEAQQKALEVQAESASPESREQIEEDLATVKKKAEEARANVPPPLPPDME